MEQRRHQRFELHLPYEIQQVPGRGAIRGETRNLSGQGALLACSVPLTVGETIEYSVTLPAPGSGALVRILCSGRVLRCDRARAEVAASIERYEFVREQAASAAA
jgi:hypothetical protein